MTTRSIVAIAALGLACTLPMPATAGGYSAEVKVYEGRSILVSATGTAEWGEPMTSGVEHVRRDMDGDPVVPPLVTGFRLKVMPRRTGEDIDVRIGLSRSDVDDAAAGTVREEVAALEGKAVRVGDGWRYETDRLPGGKVLRLTLRDLGGTE